MLCDCQVRQPQNTDRVFYHLMIFIGHSLHPGAFAATANPLTKIANCATMMLQSLIHVRFARLADSRIESASYHQFKGSLVVQQHGPDDLPDGPTSVSSGSNLLAGPG